MALRNRKQEETSQLKGVNLIDEETDLGLGNFTRLQNYIPAEVYSLKKKRGVRDLGVAWITTEEGDYITTEEGFRLITETTHNG